jgi:ABC-type nitrate/sulfonate/bicarbonate transport system permease component
MEQSLPSVVGVTVGVSVGVEVGVLVGVVALGAANVKPPIIRANRIKPIADPMAICLG